MTFQYFRQHLLGALIVGMLLSGERAWAHEGPDPIAHWFFSENTMGNGIVKARLGADAEIIGSPRLVKGRHGSALYFDGTQDRLTIAADVAQSRFNLPTNYLTVAVWVTVDQPKANAGIVSAAQVHAEGQKGWSLGYDDHAFEFMLASVGADDGDGLMTTLKSKSVLKSGVYFRVVATYNDRTGFRVATVSVPEPATVALMWVATVAMFFRRRTRIPQVSSFWY